MTTKKEANNYKCPECGESFDSPQNLGKHRRSKHGIAGATSASKRRAKARELKALLNGEPRTYAQKTFACPECGKSYTAPTGLGRHRQAAHGVAGTSHSIAKKNAQLSAPKRSQLAKLPKANGHVNGAHKETHAASSDPFEIPVAIAFGRFREILTSMAIEHDLSPRLFASRFAELVYRSTLR